eukprot:352788-Chlamydomonas_euryale.AAC.1
MRRRAEAAACQHLQPTAPEGMNSACSCGWADKRSFDAKVCECRSSNPAPAAPALHPVSQPAS